MQSRPPMHKLPINFPRVSLPETVLTNKMNDPKDQEETEYLIKTFIKDNYLSDIKNTNHVRKKTVSDAISSLRALIDTWHQNILSKTKENGETSKNSKAILAHYGSYRYDALMQDGDLDCLVLAPADFEREKHFFGELPGVLETDPNISDIQSIKSAYVPVLKLTYNDTLSIDLVFAAIDTSKLSYDNLEALEDDSILEGLDKETQRSLNGFRNAEKLLSIVGKLENFKITLKLVKLWAKSKGIYSNAMGYLGGVSWAIMVAKIIQLFPNFEPSVLLWHFFRFYTEWRWNEDPVQLVNVEDSNSTESVPMVIITPSYPGMNSSYNVSYSTFKIILTHFQEAWAIIYKALEEKVSIPWENIFEKYDFFKHYYQYIELSIGSDDRNSYIKWRTFVESKLRYLTKSFEFYNYEKEMDLRPYPVPFERDGTLFNYCVSYYFGFKATRGLEEVENIKNFSPIARDLLESIITHKGKEDKIRLIHIKREQLPDVVFDGKRPEWAVKEWIEKRKEAMLKLKQTKEGHQNTQNPYSFPIMNQGNYGYYPYYNNYGNQIQNNGMHIYPGNNGNYSYNSGNTNLMYNNNNTSFNKSSGDDQVESRENNEDYDLKK